MHDCPVATGDAWAKRFLGPLIASPAMADGVLFITFDEAHGDTANHIATIVVAPRLAAPVASAKQYGHPSLLRTIEQLYGLPCLADACKAEPMIDLLPPASVPARRPTSAASSSTSPSMSVLIPSSARRRSAFSVSSSSEPIQMCGESRRSLSSGRSPERAPISSAASRSALPGRHR